MFCNRGVTRSLAAVTICKGHLEAARPGRGDPALGSGGRVSALAGGASRCAIGARSRTEVKQRRLCNCARLNKVTICLGLVNW